MKLPAFAFRMALLALALVAVVFDAQPGGLAELLVFTAVSVPLMPRTAEELRQLANPSQGPEVIPFAAYDTEPYDSTVTTRLSFFATTKNDPALSNMPTAGQFPAPQYFESWYQMLDILSAPTATALDAWGDYWSILFGLGGTGGAPTFKLTLDSKEYGPYPLSFLHGTGGINGFAYSDAAAAPTLGEYANNSHPDGGWCWGGTPVIPPTSGFRVVLEWPSALTLQADTNLRVTMLGALHRKML